MRNEQTQDTGALVQRLYRILWGAMALEQSTIKILERATLHLAPPEPVDAADLTDRLHELFNAYSFLTRVKLWQDVDNDVDNEP